MNYINSFKYVCLIVHLKSDLIIDYFTGAFNCIFKHELNKHFKYVCLFVSIRYDLLVY